MFYMNCIILSANPFSAAFSLPRFLDCRAFSPAVTPPRCATKQSNHAERFMTVICIHEYAHRQESSLFCLLLLFSVKRKLFPSHTYTFFIHQIHYSHHLRDRHGGGGGVVSLPGSQHLPCFAWSLQQTSNLTKRDAHLMVSFDLD